MRLYRYYAEFDKDDLLLWHVYENQTGQIVDTFLFEDDAQKRTMDLEKGIGFAGFTPSFIVRKVSIPTDINEAFAAEFA